MPLLTGTIGWRVRGRGITMVVAFNNPPYEITLSEVLIILFRDPPPPSAHELSSAKAFRPNPPFVGGGTTIRALFNGCVDQVRDPRPIK